MRRLRKKKESVIFQVFAACRYAKFMDLFEHGVSGSAPAAGLVNVGNTCYLAAVLQALSPRT